MRFIRRKPAPVQVVPDADIDKLTADHIAAHRQMFQERSWAGHTYRAGHVDRSAYPVWHVTY